ncbi:MAG TPA: diguanylate cyclase [Geobacteraceae bacterium]
MPRNNNFMLYQILQGIPVPAFVIDRVHVIAHWNKAMETLSGLSAAEMIGTRGHWRSFHASERPLMADLIVENTPDNALASFYAGKCRKSTLIEAAWELESHFTEFRTGAKWLFCTAAPLTDDSGRITGAIETLQDITEQKLAAERYREMSITDSLTKLYNSRHFFRQLACEVERAKRYETPLSLILLDIDNFKGYNDTYGHLEGDEVLKVLSEVLKKDLRSCDSAYRYGGEEFTLLLPETGSASALIAAERLRSDFARRVLTPLSGTEVHMTISIGVGQYLPAEPASGFLRRVDEAMYEAKGQGKNRVVPARCRA